MKKFLAALSLAATAAIVAPSMAAAVEAEGAWESWGTGLSETIDDNVYDVVEGPDGNLYVTGCIYNVSGVAEADVIAMWDGTAWSALGSNGEGDGYFDDGCGYSITWDSSDNLILGGSWLRNDDDTSDQALFKWDGTTWTNLAQDKITNNDGIRDVEVDSTDAIYFGGPFTNVNGVEEIDYLGKLDGGVFSAVGDDGSGGRPINGHVMAIEIDSSDDVYVGGKFTNAGGVAEADAVAKWDGSAWTGLGSNGSGDGYFLRNSGSDVVTDLLLTSGTLYVAANYFETPVDANQGVSVYEFDGTNFSATFDVSWLDDMIRALDFDSDTNSLLIAGWFEDANGETRADGLVSYDLDTDSLGYFGNVGTDGVDSDGDGFSVTYLGSGDIAYGGWFEDLASIPAADNIGIWDGATDSWSSVGSVLDGAFNDDVWDAQLGPDGNVYVAGCFRDASGDPTADAVAMWDGESWVGLGDDGSGNGVFAEGWGCGHALDWTPEGDLILAGRALKSDGSSEYQSLYKWDGAVWTNLAPDMITNSNGLRDVVVNADGSMYIAGPATDMDGNPDLDYIALWNDGELSEVGDDGSGGHSLNNHALNLELDDAGNLYVSGKFTNAGGVDEADLVAMWDGNAWSELGSDGAADGFFEPVDGGSQIHAMEWVDGTLYVGANYVNVDGLSDVYAIYGFTDGVFAPVIDGELLDGHIRDFAYDYETNRLLVAGYFENVDDEPIADGLIGIGLDDAAIYTYGGLVYDADTEANGADRYADGNSVAFIGDGNILYTGQFTELNGEDTADHFGYWNGPDVDDESELAATGADGTAIVFLAIASAIAIAGGIGIRRRLA